MERRLAVSTFWEIEPMDFLSSLKRFVPPSRSRMIRTFQRSEMSISVVSTGQAGSSLFINTNPL